MRTYIKPSTYNLNCSPDEVWLLYAALDVAIGYCGLTTEDNNAMIRLRDYLVKEFGFE
jgi:hypothetical protein